MALKGNVAIMFGRKFDLNPELFIQEMRDKGFVYGIHAVLQRVNAGAKNASDDQKGENCQKRYDAIIGANGATPTWTLGGSGEGSITKKEASARIVEINKQLRTEKDEDKRSNLYDELDALAELLD